MKMELTAMRRLSAVSLSILYVVLTAGQLQGLVIYRFGGEDVSPPPEADSAGVQFVQVGWEEIDLGAGGNEVEVDTSPARIAALRRDPQFNIAPTAEDHGGEYLRAPVNGQVWDGDTNTVWTAQRYLCAEFDEKNYFLRCIDDFGTPGTATINLGGLFQIDRVRIVSGLRDAGKTVTAVRIWMDVEIPRVSVTLHPPAFDEWVVELRDNRQTVWDIPIPPREEVRYVQVALLEHDTEWEVHSIEIFAKGFVKRSTYTSNIIDFGRKMAWGELRWSGQRDERAKLSIQTRSGADDDPVLYWRFTGRGQDREAVTARQYGDLKLGERAPTSYDQENWSFWSTYDFADSTGAQIVSVSPRRYLQFQVDFLPLGEDGGRVDYLEFRASEPLVTDLVGEVWPVEVRVGEITDFTYFLRPRFSASDAGFDRLQIQSLALLGEVREVRVADVVVPHTVLVSEPHSLLLSLPRVETQDSGALVEVDFTAQVLRYGSRFDGRVSDSSLPLEVPQSVNSGDATGEYEGNTVSVATSVADGGELLQVRVDAPVLTPNGDGVNESVALAYEIFEITGTATVRVEVFDLSARRVRLVHEARDGIGAYVRFWDGQNEDGQLMPPGIYPYSISIDADREQVRKVGLLYVAY